MDHHQKDGNSLGRQGRPPTTLVHKARRRDTRRGARKPVGGVSSQRALAVMERAVNWMENVTRLGKKICPLGLLVCDDGDDSRRLCQGSIISLVAYSL
jgi:hypothetical protein